MKVWPQQVLDTSTERNDRPTLNPALRSFWTQPADVRVLYGGRSSSKSWDAAGFAVFLADNYKLRILCVRQFQNKIAESVYTLLKIQIERFGLSDRFDIQRDRIINRFTGSEFIFYGLWRSIDEIKSLEGIDILWIEEAHNLTEEQWKILEPTIRKAYSQVWVIFNPRFATDFVFKRFVVNPPARTVCRKINYDENPFLSEKIRRVIETLRSEDEEEYRHVYLGEPKDGDDSVIIKRRWIMAAIDANLTLQRTPRGSKRLGFDIADSGDDKCALIGAYGFHADFADEWKAAEDELLKSCSRAHDEAARRDSVVTYDSIGVGAMAGAKFNELNAKSNGTIHVQHVKFNAGAAVINPARDYVHGKKNKDMFRNLKAQAWWMVADRFRNTFNAVQNGHLFEDDQIISISSQIPHLEKLIDELSTPMRDYDENGLVKVESKKDLAKRDIPSPNLADAFIMAFAPGGSVMPVFSNEILAQLGVR